MRFEMDMVARLLESEWWVLSFEDVKSLDVSNLDICLAEVMRLKADGRGIPEAFIDFDTDF